MPRFGGFRAKPMGRYMPGPSMANAYAHIFPLAWDASTSPLVVGYRIKVTFQDGSTPPGSPKDVGNRLDGEFGVFRGGTYTFVVVGLFSDNSETAPTASVSDTWTPGP